MSKIAIVIVNWNGKSDTINCLQSLQRVKLKENLNIFVVDNGSTDRSAEAIKKKFPSIHLIQNEKNLGFTGGNNAGIARALEDGAHYVWLLNNDTLVDPQALEELVEALGHPGAGIVGSKIYFAPGHEFHKDRYAPKDKGKVIWFAGGNIDWKNMYASHKGVDEVDKGQFNEIEETAFITGCSMMVKRDVFETIGMLDDRYYLYLEDVDLCLRAKQAGYKIVFVPLSKIWHVNARSSGGPGSSLHEYYLTRNRLVLGMKFAPFRTKFALLREAIRFFFSGSSVRKKAVQDYFLGKLGEQIL